MCARLCARLCARVRASLRASYNCVTLRAVVQGTMRHYTTVVNCEMWLVDIYRLARYYSNANKYERYKYRGEHAKHAQSITFAFGDEKKTRGKSTWRSFSAVMNYFSRLPEEIIVSSTINLCSDVSVRFFSN